MEAEDHRLEAEVGRIWTRPPKGLVNYWESDEQGGGYLLRLTPEEAERREKKEKRAMASYDPRVIAIRNDELVGRGSCASIDECWEDKEIIEELDRAAISTTEGAIKWAWELEGIRLEKGMNQLADSDNPQAWQDVVDRRNALEA